MHSLCDCEQHSDQCTIRCGGFFLASTEPLGLWARLVSDLTADVGGSEENSVERPSKLMEKSQQRSRAEGVPGVG